MIPLQISIYLSNLQVWCLLANVYYVPILICLIDWCKIYFYLYMFLTNPAYIFWKTDMHICFYYLFECCMYVFSLPLLQRPLLVCVTVPINLYSIT